MVMTTMNDNDEPTIDLDAYQRRIGLDLGSRAAPTLALLARLIEHHARAIPFENIEVMAGRVPALDTGALQAKMLLQKRGGYCFEQNNLLRSCLLQLGYEVQRLEARVRAGVPAEVVTGRTHMALRVTIDAVPYLADVGFGGMAPVAPLEFDSRGEQHAADGLYRLVDVEGDLLMQTKGHEGWADCYRIMPVAPQHIDYEIGNWYVATHAKSMLRQNLLVARAVPGGRLMLFNRQLTLRRPATAVPIERTLATRAEVEAVLADDFDLQIDAADLDAVMRIIAPRDA